MSRRRRQPRKEDAGPAGFLVIDKPPGRTSHDVVDEARVHFGTRRVGHLGTLDPQATGVLPLAIRAATKLVPFLPPMQKVYVGTVRLGAETDTLDGEGRVLRRHDGKLPGEEEVLEALADFVGEIDQVPPMYSAVKKDGVPLHRLARRGQEVERAAKRVTVHSLELLRFESPDAEISVECGPGTYVRTLAADLGEKLGCGAYLHSLRRLVSGSFEIGQAITLEQLAEDARAGKQESHLIGPAAVLAAPEIHVLEDAARRISNGGDISPGSGLRVAPGTRVLVRDAEGELLALAELRPDRRLWPLRVLRPS
jgi:tRNA pseudouridine55 synthase